MWTSLATVAISREISTALAEPPIRTTTCPKRKQSNLVVSHQNIGENHYSQLPRFLFKYSQIFYTFPNHKQFFMIKGEK